MRNAQPKSDDLWERWSERLEELSSTEAQRLIKTLSAELEFLQRRELRYRVLLGRLLLLIQDREHYREFHGGYKTWTEFLSVGFRKLTGLELRTAYDAIELARSNTVATLAEQGNQKSIRISNARHIVRLEKAKQPITEEIMQKAQRLPTREFQRQTGASKGYLVRLWVKDEEVGREIQRIAELLVNGSADALQALREILESEELIKRAGYAVDNKVDCILGILAVTCHRDWREEQEQLEAAQPQRKVFASTETPEPIEPEDESMVPGTPSVRQVEQITGLEIKLKAKGSRVLAYGYRDGEANPLVCGSSESGDAEAALQMLVEENWHRLQRIVFQEQHWQCAHCGRVKELQLHHRTFRSHARDDRRENLEGLCSECHNRKHGIKTVYD